MFWQHIERIFVPIAPSLTKVKKEASLHALVDHAFVLKVVFRSLWGMWSADTNKRYQGNLPQQLLR